MDSTQKFLMWPCWHVSLSYSSLDRSSLLTRQLMTIIQSHAQHSLITDLRPSASPVIRLEMIRAQLPYTRAARGLLVGYDCLDWLDSLATCDEIFIKGTSYFPGKHWASSFKSAYIINCHLLQNKRPLLASVCTCANTHAWRIPLSTYMEGRRH